MGYTFNEYYHIRAREDHLDPKECKVSLAHLACLVDLDQKAAWADLATRATRVILDLPVVQVSLVLQDYLD